MCEKKNRAVSEAIVSPKGPWSQKRDKGNSTCLIMVIVVYMSI